jgi:mono/diheme cytochrome c family protein
MKKNLFIAGWIVAGIAIMSCNKVRRNTGRAYMPDMAYSNAYETYGSSEERLAKSGAHYNGHPVEGTIARGDMFPYTLKNDTLGYAQSASVKNPLPPLSAKDYLEASRLYLINCGICHGDKLDGNGPLFKGGEGPFIAKPATLIGDATYEAMPEGTMFHSVTYGRNAMGSYASQLSTQQRWMIIHYIKEKQKVAGSASAAAADSTKAAVDTAKTNVDTTATTK